MLHLFGAEPDLESTFEDQRDRDAGRNFMDLLAIAKEDQPEG